jgi:uncharacterized protein YdaU (DUF1376 family)
MHYYQHHIGDFIKATSRLSDCQTMAYLRLLWMYYDSEKPLKPDIKILAFQIGASHEDTELLLKSYFVLCENGWHQKRCDKEIEEYRELLNKKSNAGKASAEQRKNRRSTDVEQVLNSSGTVEQLTNNHEPITNNHSIEEPPTKQRTKGSRLSADFDLPNSWTEFCQTERPDLNPQKVFDSFKDYWTAKAGAAGVKLDWQATWRNWVRNQNVAKQMFNKADVVHQTVPGSSQRDPALVKLDEDRMRSAPPNPEVLAKIREVLGKGKVA